MAKNIQNSHLFTYFLERSIKKIEAKKSKFYFHNCLGNIVVHIRAKNLKDRMKTEGPYLIWKRLTDRRTPGGSASDKLRWLLCQQWSLKEKKVKERKNR